MDQQQQPGQNQQQPDQSSSSPLGVEQILRSEVNRGCLQVRQFEEKVQSLIQSPAFYPALIVDAASIIATFANVITQLNRWNTKQAVPAVTTTPIPIPVPLRPSINPALLTTASSSMICSPIRAPTPPHSPSNLALSSPHTTSSSSPVLTPEGSPSNPTAPMDGAAADAAMVEDFPGSGIGRKRKCLPRTAVKVPANSNEQGNESPADDGFTWRKYGQKDILNSKFPRSYYRCTHQKELGCQATKQVQKCEDEPSMYQVTYFGDHSCQNALTTFWMGSGLSTRSLSDNPFSVGLGQSTSVSVTAAAAAAAAAVAASLSLPSSSPSFVSRLEDMKTSRLTLSPKKPADTFNLLKPTLPLASPSQWITPRFGGLSCPVKSEPLAIATSSTSPLEPSPSSLENDKRLLKMSLGSSGVPPLPLAPSSSPPGPPPPPSSSSSTGAAAAATAAASMVAVSSSAGEHENIQELWNVGIPDVGMDVPRSSASLPDFLGDMMSGYDQSMLFEPED